MGNYTAEKERLSSALRKRSRIRTAVELLLVIAGMPVFLVCGAALRLALAVMLPAAILALNIWAARAQRRDLNRALQQIMEENDTIRLNLKNARLSALVSQMDPHFLFNTLQLLQDEFAYGSRETSNSIIRSLSDIYRYSTFSSRVLVPLQEELDFARSYMSIYEQIYEGNLHVDFQTEADCNGCTVPRFIIQPLLENAIKHGFDNAPYKNSIVITTERQADRLLIRVEDDGVGMSEEDCARLQESILTPGSDSTGGGIGLRNVQQRIQLLYGKGYGLTLSTREPKGLCAELSLPADPGQEGGPRQGEEGEML